MQCNNYADQHLDLTGEVSLDSCYSEHDNLNCDENCDDFLMSEPGGANNFTTLGKQTAAPSIFSISPASSAASEVGDIIRYMPMMLIPLVNKTRETRLKL